MGDQLGYSSDVGIVAAIPLEFLDDADNAVPLDADFVYVPDDPYAVTVVFGNEADEVRWTFGRELLIHGLHKPGGLGDVRVWPCLDGEGQAVVVMELCTSDAAVLLQAPSRAVSEFLQRTLGLVPRGEESSRLDVDAALRQLLPE